FLTAVTGNVNDAAGVVVIDESAAAEHVVEHAEDGFFVSGNDAGGEDDGVIFVDGDEAMVVNGNARKGRHGLGLRAAGEDEKAAGVEAANVLGTDDHAIGNLQDAERMRDFDVIDHAAADERNFAPHASGDVDDLLDAVN